MYVLHEIVKGINRRTFMWHANLTNNMEINKSARRNIDCSPFTVYTKQSKSVEAFYQTVLPKKLTRFLFTQSIILKLFVMYPHMPMPMAAWKLVQLTVSIVLTIVLRCWLLPCWSAKIFWPRSFLHHLLFVATSANTHAHHKLHI